MTLPSLPIRLGLLPTSVLLLGGLAAQAQLTPDPAIPITPVRRAKPRPPKATQPTLNPNLVVLDPAHGGADEGAHLDHDVKEKDITIAFASRLRTLLITRGFTVVTTHESASDEITPDARVEIANRSHPAACLLLHVASSGHGVHLFTSALSPQTFAPFPSSSSPDDFSPILPWDTAQSSIVPQSLRLASDLSTGLNGVRLPLVLGQSSIRPIDSMLCPAIAVELAPLPGGSAQTSPADPGYQARVAEAIASGLTLWRGHVASQLAAAQAAKTASNPLPSSAAPSKAIPKPKPKPVTPPVETPDQAAPSRPAAPSSRKPGDRARSAVIAPGSAGRTQ